MANFFDVFPVAQVLRADPEIASRHGAMLQSPGACQRSLHMAGRGPKSRGQHAEAPAGSTHDLVDRLVGQTLHEQAEHHNYIVYG
jgi:hypothetical protein